MLYNQKKCFCNFLIMSFCAWTVLFICPVHLIDAADEKVIQGKVTILDKHGHSKKDNSGVVVFLDELDQLPVPVTQKKRVVMQQINKKFIPEVLPIRMGTTVDFPNDDMVFHNVFSFSKAKNFDLGLYKQGESRSVTFDKPGLVKIYCNIHPQMLGYILVLNNPYFTVTDNNGRFTLPRPQAGQAKVRTWHSKSKKYPEQEIQITSEGVKDLNFEITEDLRFQIKEESISIKHKNKWGQDYPSKY